MKAEGRRTSCWPDPKAEKGNYQTNPISRKPQGINGLQQIPRPDGQSAQQTCPAASPVSGETPTQGAPWPQEGNRTNKKLSQRRTTGAAEQRNDQTKPISS